MTSTGYLLDTNIISPAFAQEKALAQRIDEAGIVFVPFVVVAELRYGAYHAGPMSKQLLKVNDFVSRFSILHPDDATSDFFGQIKADLRIAGQMIPDHDIWISSLAVQHKLTIVTRDAHFIRIDGLRLERW